MVDCASVTGTWSRSSGGSATNSFSTRSLDGWSSETGLEVRFDLAMTRKVGIAGTAEFAERGKPPRDSRVEPIPCAEGPPRTGWGVLATRAGARASGG